MVRPFNIVAATDLSGPARHGVERAAMLAKARPDARCLLFHVVNAGAIDRLRRLLDTDAEAEPLRRLIAGAEAELSQLADQMRARHGVVMASQAAVGRVLDAIQGTCAAVDADLLVMGARGANFVREFLLGSTTERILRKSRTPVLAVKQHPHEPYRRLLVPVDFSVHSRPAVELARRIAPDADITLLHAFEVEFESKLQFAGVGDGEIERYRVRAKQQAMADMERLIAGLDVPAERLTRRIVHGPASVRVLEEEQELGADLIVIGKRGQNLIEETLLGSVTKHLLAYSDCDVLVSGQPA